MNHAPSRRERREYHLKYSAKLGKFKVDNLCLFKGESDNLTKHGLFVKRHGDDKKASLPSLVSWERAFANGTPPIVYNYIIGTIETFPQGLNWAQELYVIAARANYLKGTKK